MDLAEGEGRTLNVDHMIQIVHATLTFLVKDGISIAEGVDVMKIEMSTPQAVTANTAIEGEIRDLVHAERLSATETDAEIAPLVRKVGASSIAEIEKLMGELQEAKNYLQSEGERIQRETTRYTNLTRTASASVKIIFDTVREWREAGHPVRNQSKWSAFEITPAPTKDRSDAHSG
jgi:hypothetical protein